MWLHQRKGRHSDTTGVQVPTLLNLMKEEAERLEAKLNCTEDPNLATPEPRMNVRASTQ